uniref:Phospholipase A2 domain-containing protein n=1 Tax=Romanomermis culicivorax TaxID=13658 RepID=A0A915KU14_ROMCU
MNPLRSIQDISNRNIVAVEILPELSNYPEYRERQCRIEPTDFKAIEKRGIDCFEWNFRLNILNELSQLWLSSDDLNKECMEIFNGDFSCTEILFVTPSWEQYVVKEYAPVFKAYTIIANVGGVLGVWTGASALSLVHILVMCTCSTRARRRWARGMDAAQVAGMLLRASHRAGTDLEQCFNIVVTQCPQILFNRCCQHHDQCYEHCAQRGCDPLVFASYTFECDDKKRTASLTKSNECSKCAFDCDLKASRCFRDNISKLKNRTDSQVQCKTNPLRNTVTSLESTPWFPSIDGQLEKVYYSIANFFRSSAGDYMFYALISAREGISNCLATA